ncbi:unnamed protein product [Lactuca saligna]|uniref:Uncharacterized protein n=1 Tax=Lactuca saligna TaxID=75948 RepID=A0AA36A1L1_LACSI|nr:unnamed protein product [Lactuca saligna]
MEVTIEEKKIQVTESIIRESLQIEDRIEYPMEIDVHQTEEILEHMGYEGTFPPTIKKLLPQCWKLLAHVFVSCISGRRSGANEISLANTGAIAALAAENVREESEEQSMPMENEDIPHSPTKLEVEEIHHSPTAYVADEHDNLKENDSKSSREDDENDLYEDMEFLKEIDFTGINDDIPTNIEFDFGDEDFDPFLDIPSSRPLDITTSQGDVTSEIPPFVSPVSTSSPVISDLTEPQTSQTSIRTSQSLESMEVPSVRCAPQVISTITATSAHSPPNQTDEDEASIRLVKYLAQSGPTSSHGKGISFNEGRTDDDKSSSSDLREEIRILRKQLIEKSIQMDQLSAHIFELGAKDEEKTKQINDLQTSLGYVLANYFNLKNILYDAFDEEVKALFQQPHGVVDPPSVQSPPATEDLPVNPPAPRTTTIVNRFEKEAEGSRARITIKQGKRIVTANQSEGLLFMKNSNENRKTRDPVSTIMDLKKRKFGDEYGDRTGASECYKSTHDFNSWTKIDLAELSRAPFHNPSKDPNASNFKRFLDRQPATKKQKEIPIPQHFHEGYLDDMKFWAYDDETTTATIKFKNQEHVLRLISAKDLLRFRERDIRTLARHQIICRKDAMEAAAKEFTAMVATIIKGRLWMGSMGTSDMRLFEKSAEEPKE